MRKKSASSLLSRQHWPMMPSHLSRSILFVLLSVVPIAAQAADKRGITEKDLFDFIWIGDPQISPDEQTGVRCRAGSHREGENRG